MNVYELDGNTAHEVWPVLKEFLAPAMSYHAYMDGDDLYWLVMTGKGQVVAMIDDGEIKGAAVMQIVSYPQTTVGHVLALGGKPGFLRRYMETFIDHLIEWSRARGCHKIGFSGRTEWPAYFQGRYGVTKAPETVTMWMPIERDMDVVRH